MASKIIVIEGTDGTGKETQSKLLEKRLKELGKKCIKFGFPMYESPTGKIVGGPYLGKPEFGETFFSEGAVSVDPHVVCLYYAADRKYNMSKIQEYLDKGYYVILDRYTTSNLAYQGSKIKDKDERFNMYQWIDKLEYWLLGLPKPDKTIFLHMPYKNAVELNKTRDREQLDEYEKDYEQLKLAEEAYIELSQLYNWDRIECTKDGHIRTVEEINDDILELVKGLD